MSIPLRFVCRFGGLAFAASVLLTAADASAQYNAEISRWQAQDALDPTAADPVLFVGSSSIRRWEQMTHDFADYNVLQRGLGGSLMSDMLAREGDLVLAYHPRAVVLWAGTNDLAAGATGGSVAWNFKRFADTLLAAQPGVDLFYIGIMPTPGRQSNRPQEDIANAQISAYCQTNAKLHYIDMPAAFASFNPYSGAAFTSKFVDDIHLNRDGYNYWSGVIRPQIESVVAPNKTFSLNANTLKAGEKLLFDFGPSDAANGDATDVDSNGKTWNNWYGVGGGASVLPGEHKANLVTTAGRNTGIRMTITAQFSTNGKQNGGLTAPNAALLGDFAIPSVTEDYFYSTADNQQGGGNDDVGGGFMIDGLDPAKTYDFRLFAARDSTETRVTRYDLIGANTVSATLTTSGAGIGAGGANTNNSEILTLSGVRPDAYGNIYFDMTLVRGSFAYISAMEITAVPEPTTAAGVATAATLLLSRRRRRG
jgi:lysophospholipase L1-like esterase